MSKRMKDKISKIFGEFEKKCLLDMIARPEYNKLKKEIKNEFKRELSEWNNIYYEQEEKIKELKTADVKHKMKINRLEKENREFKQTLEKIKKGEYIPEIFVDDLNELSRLREKLKEIAYNVKENTDKKWIERIEKITEKYDYWFNEIQHLIAEIQRKNVKLSEFSERDLQKLYDQASKFLIELQELINKQKVK